MAVLNLSVHKAKLSVAEIRLKLIWLVFLAYLIAFLNPFLTTSFDPYAKMFFFQAKLLVFLTDVFINVEYAAACLHIINWSLVTYK